MSSLKVLYFSFNGFSKRVYAINYSPRRIYNRTRRSNSPISHSGTRFSSEEAQLSSGEAKLLRLRFTQVQIVEYADYGQALCHALSNQVSKFVVNIDLEAEMYGCRIVAIFNSIILHSRVYICIQ